MPGTKTSGANGRSSAHHEFGYRIMGPILAECCRLLYQHLSTLSPDGDTRILFCTRGGLIMRQALNRYLNRIESIQRIDSADLHISRLSAARTAIESDPTAVELLLKGEFKGRSCAEAASVLAGFTIDKRGAWAQPYNLRTLLQLFDADADGQRACQAMFEQAQLLREHVAQQAAGAGRLIITDTGVYGSIGHYLSAGLPGHRVESVLLFHADYKKIRLDTVCHTVGLVCTDSTYTPWRSRSLSRLYWPLIEAFFEPPLESVRLYRTAADGRIVSNLCRDGWEQSLAPSGQSIRAGAFDYLDDTDKADLLSNSSAADRAWTRLRRMIVFPTPEDTEILGLSQKSVDFGFDETYSLTAASDQHGLMSAWRHAVRTPWPEGALVRLCPGRSGLILRVMEAGRFTRALGRAALFRRP